MKTRNGWSRAKMKKIFWDSWAKQTKEWKSNDWTASEASIEVLYPLKNQKFELLIPECLPPNSQVYHGGSWRLSNYHIQRLKKWIFLRCLIFKEFIFLEKSLGNVPPLLHTSIVKIDLLSQIIWFQVNTPFEDFWQWLPIFRDLQKKKMTLSGMINRVLKIFCFQALRKPRF